MALNLNKLKSNTSSTSTVEDTSVINPTTLGLNLSLKKTKAAAQVEEPTTYGGLNLTNVINNQNTLQPEDIITQEGFSLSFTTDKVYDLDAMILEKMRDNSERTLILRTITNEELQVRLIELVTKKMLDDYNIEWTEENYKTQVSEIENFARLFDIYFNRYYEEYRKYISKLENPGSISLDSIFREINLTKEDIRKYTLADVAENQASMISYSDRYKPVVIWTDGSNDNGEQTQLDQYLDYEKLYEVLEDYYDKDSVNEIILTLGETVKNNKEQLDNYIQLFNELTNLVAEIKSNIETEFSEQNTINETLAGQIAILQQALDLLSTKYNELYELKANKTDVYDKEESDAKFITSENAYLEFATNTALQTMQSEINNKFTQADLAYATKDELSAAETTLNNTINTEISDIQQILNTKSEYDHTHEEFGTFATQQALQDAISMIENAGYAKESYVDDKVVEINKNISDNVEYIENNYVKNETFQLALSDIQDQIPSIEGFITEDKIDGKISDAISSVYRVKGSKETFNDLPKINNVIGDVWNVNETGDNYVWNGSEWDRLGGVVDLSEYAKRSELFSKKYEDLTGKPDLSIYAKSDDIPSIDHLATSQELIDTKNEILDQIPNVDDFITGIPDEYITEEELLSKKYVNADELADAINKIPEPDLTGYAKETFVESSILALINNAPADLNTLGKLANAINNNPEFYKSIQDELLLKANASDVYSTDKIDSLLSTLDETLKQYVDSEVTDFNIENINNYEVLNKTKSTLLNFTDSEIRICIYDENDFANTTNAEGEYYYLTLKVYAPENAKYFRYNTQETPIDPDSEYYEFGNSEYDAVDDNGKKYSFEKIKIASSFDSWITWEYIGTNSNFSNPVFIPYKIEWYDENKNIINFDSKVIVFLQKDEIHDPADISSVSVINMIMTLLEHIFLNSDENYDSFAELSEAIKKQGEILRLAYKVKGSKETFNDLPTENNTIGDVWNLLDTGDNYVWTESGWDKLGGTIDLSEYAKRSELFSKKYEDLTGKPDLFSGNYEDLTNKPIENDFTLRDTVSEDTTNVLRELEIAGDKWKIEAGLDKDQILELGFVTTDDLSKTLNEYSKTNEIESIIANYMLANYGNGNTEEF